MTLHKQVKYNAKRCLCNNWGKAVAIVLLSTAIYLLFVIIELLAHLLLQLPASSAILIPGVSDGWILSLLLSLVTAVGSFILLVPLNLGTTRWYFDLSDGRSEDILNIFCCFAHKKLFFRSLGLALDITVRILFYSILYLTLPLAAVIFSLWLITASTFTGAIFVGSMLLILSVALFSIALVFLLICTQKYFLAKYYLLDKNITVREAIRSSIHATRGHRDSIFCFKLSFIGWAISSVLILPMLYFAAYFSMSSLLYARVLIEQDRRANSLVPFQSEPQPEDLDDTKTFDQVEHPSDIQD